MCCRCSRLCRSACGHRILAATWECQDAGLSDSVSSDGMGDRKASLEKFEETQII